MVCCVFSSILSYHFLKQNINLQKASGWHGPRICHGANIGLGMLHTLWLIFVRVTQGGSFSCCAAAEKLQLWEVQELVCSYREAWGLSTVHGNVETIQYTLWVSSRRAIVWEGEGLSNVTHPGQDRFLRSLGCGWGWYLPVVSAGGGWQGGKN